MKDLNETDEEDEGFVQVAFQKRKTVGLVTTAPKRVKKVQPVSEPRVSVIPLQF